MDELLPRLTLAGASVRGREDMHGHVFSTLLLQVGYNQIRLGSTQVQQSDHQFQLGLATNRYIPRLGWVLDRYTRVVHTAADLHHYDGIHTK